ncbi:MAG: 50S ribosomal protein L10 [SAR202 cluster bacterium]|nr:50S ribosomal protein L10 [SAR202 cluster bacterium]
MPTQEKVQEVEELKKKIGDCTIAISASYTGQTVASMTAMRRALRAKGVEFRVVKNTLAGIAADAAGKPALKGIIKGQTGIAFGYGDPAEPAKLLSDYIRTNRMTLEIRGGVLGKQALSVDEVRRLAELPPKNELIAKLLGQAQAPIASFVYVLNAPLTALAIVLQRRVEKGA